MFSLHSITPSKYNSIWTRRSFHIDRPILWQLPHSPEPSVWLVDTRYCRKSMRRWEVSLSRSNFRFGSKAEVGGDTKNVRSWGRSGRNPVESGHWSPTGHSPRPILGCERGLGTGDASVQAHGCSHSPSGRTSLSLLRHRRGQTRLLSPERFLSSPMDGRATN